MKKILLLLGVLFVAKYADALQTRPSRPSETLDTSRVINVQTKSTTTFVDTTGMPNIEMLELNKLEKKKIQLIPLIPERTIPQAIIAVTAIITAASNGMEYNSIPVAESLISLVCAIVMVSTLTAAVERQCRQNIPLFDPTKNRFDQSSFSGRFFRMLLMCDPRLLLFDEKEARQYLDMVNNYKTIRDGTAETDRILWEAKRISDAALHPETTEWIPRAFRMSGYLVFNGPICIAMVCANSTLSLLFWSWLNQSQNALVNYYNRSASSKTSNDTLVKSYVAAVGSALLIAFGLENFVQNHFSGDEAAALARFISFPSAIIASSLNCFIVRSPEIKSGVPLLTESGKNVLPGETSCIAAKRGVYGTTASRAILQIPTFCISPLVLDSLPPLQQFIQTNPSSEVPITTFLLLLSFGIGLPMVVGLLPQISGIAVDDVESKYNNLGYKELFYDKGL